MISNTEKIIRQIRGTGGDCDPGKGEKSSEQSKEQMQTPKGGTVIVCARVESEGVRGKWEQCQRQTISSLLFLRVNLHVYEILTTEWQQVIVQEKIKTKKKKEVISII